MNRDSRYMRYTCSGHPHISSNTLRPGDSYSFLMMETMVFPGLALWVMGKAISSSQFKVSKTLGMYDQASGTLLGRDGLTYQVEYSPMLDPGDVSHPGVYPMLGDTTVTVYGMVRNVFYETGVDFNRLDPVLIPDNGQNARMTWPMHELGSECLGWMVASWVDTVRRSPHMILRAPELIANMIDPVVGAADDSGILD